MISKFLLNSIILLKYLLQNYNIYVYIYNYNNLEIF